MLVAVNSERTLFGQTRSDAVGALALLAPDRRGPQAPRLERLVVGRCATPVDRHAVAVGQQHAAADAADGEKQPIKVGLRGPDQRLDLLPRQFEFGLAQPARLIAFGGVEAMKFG
jgi:hypothetical protein